MASNTVLEKKIPEIDKHLSKIKPSNEIHRMPRSIDCLSFFKASELRAWLLFYSLPVLALYLPPEYTHHLSLLVASFHILLSDCIQIKDLDLAHRMLSVFFQTAGDL